MSEGLSATGFEALLGEKSFLLADGATGTNLFAMGLESGEAPEAWLLEHPDRVQALHQSFVEAGSDLFLTNTFGGTRHRLQLHGLDDQVGSLNRRAAQLAREVADKSGRRVLVAGSVGPTGEISSRLASLSARMRSPALPSRSRGWSKAGSIWSGSKPSRPPMSWRLRLRPRADLTFLSVLP